MRLIYGNWSLAFVSACALLWCYAGLAAGLDRPPGPGRAGEHPFGVSFAQREDSVRIPGQLVAVEESERGLVLRIALPADMPPPDASGAIPGRDGRPLFERKTLPPNVEVEFEAMASEERPGRLSEPDLRSLKDVRVLSVGRDRIVVTDRYLVAYGQRGVRVVPRPPGGAGELRSLLRRWRDRAEHEPERDGGPGREGRPGRPGVERGRGGNGADGGRQGRSRDELRRPPPEERQREERERHGPPPESASPEPPPEDHDR